MAHQHDDDSLTTGEVGRAQGIPTSTVRRHIRAGRYSGAFQCQECAPTSDPFWRIPRKDLFSEQQDPLFDLDSLTDG